VVYLARKNDGPHAFRTFLNSYKTYPAGLQHTLIIAFKGYTGPEELRLAHEEFSSFSYTALEIPDEGFGLGSCLEVAKRLPHTYICWFNTKARIMGDNWLKKFYFHLVDPEVGMVSATGSYEGIYDSANLMQKAIWLDKRQELNSTQRANLNKYFGFLLPPSYLRVRPNWTDGLRLLKFLGKKSLNSLCNVARRFSSQGMNLLELHEQWNKKIKSESIMQYSAFPRFPNPHLRPNGFMIHRKYLADEKRYIFLKKVDELDFECGEKGLTRKILQAGLKAKIVGLNGIAYDIDQWPHSNTFRLGKQSNLLVADNQTDFFEALDDQARTTFELFTWGKKAAALPKDFPDFLESPFLSND
jgi:hypothetical protein